MSHAHRCRTTAGVLAAGLATSVLGLSAPAVANAQDAPENPTETGSTGLVSGLIPDEFQVGGGIDVETSTDLLRGLGSADAADGILSAATTIGSVGSLEVLGSTGGSAAGSVASSGLLPGSVYTNPTGSIGSGEIGLGSVSVSERAIGSLAAQAGVAGVAALGAKQEAGEFTPQELAFWHGVVESTAEVGGTLEAAAAGTGTALPGSLAGSIDSVQRAALEDPAVAQARIRAEATAEKVEECADPENESKECEDLDELRDEAAEAAAEYETIMAAAADGADADGAPADGATPDDGAAPAGGEVGDRGVAAGQGAAAPASAPTLAQAAATAPAHAAGEQESRHALAATGNDAGLMAGAAAVLLLSGGALLVVSRRRA